MAGPVASTNKTATTTTTIVQGFMVARRMNPQEDAVQRPMA
jgi:hypothetical protein